MKQVFTLFAVCLFLGNTALAIPFNWEENEVPTETNSFSSILTILKHESFDANRLKDAKNYIQSGKFSAQQIRQIAELFDYDNARLEFAKAAYTQCYDQKNYVMLRPAFTFALTFEKLMDYIGANPTTNFSNDWEWEEWEDHDHDDWGYNDNGYHNRGHHCRNGRYGHSNWENHHHRYGEWNRFPHHNRYGRNRNFQTILSILRNETFDSYRLKSAITYVKYNQLSARQIYSIARLFEFDSYRLRFAKAAYRNCYDKRNYLFLRPAFDFSSNFARLMAFVRNY